jgi:hypothetical protein
MGGLQTVVKRLHLGSTEPRKAGPKDANQNHQNRRKQTVAKTLHAGRYTPCQW